MLLTPATKEIVEDAASGGAWTSRTHRQVSRTGIDGTTPGNIRNSVSVVEPTSQVIIGIVGMFLPCGLKVIHKVANKRQSTSPGLVVQTQKMPDDIDLASIFSKVIGHKLSHSSSGDLYMICSMKFAANPVQTKTPKFMYIGF